MRKIIVDIRDVMIIRLLRVHVLASSQLQAISYMNRTVISNIQQEYREVYTPYLDNNLGR